MAQNDSAVNCKNVFLNGSEQQRKEDFNKLFIKLLDQLLRRT